MFGKELIEELEVACFLVVHVPHQGHELRIGANHWWDLGIVDEDCGEFAGLIYA